MSPIQQLPPVVMTLFTACGRYRIDPTYVIRDIVSVDDPMVERRSLKER